MAKIKKNKPFLMIGAIPTLEMALFLWDFSHTQGRVEWV